MWPLTQSLWRLFWPRPRQRDFAGRIEHIPLTQAVTASPFCKVHVYMVFVMAIGAGT